MFLLLRDKDEIRVGMNGVRVQFSLLIQWRGIGGYISVSDFRTCLAIATCTSPDQERDVAQLIACPPLKRSVIGSILLSGPSCSLGYFPFQPVVHNAVHNQRPLYVLFCLWKSAYKRSLAAYRKE